MSIGDGNDLGTDAAVAEYLTMVGRHHARSWRAGAERKQEIPFTQFRQMVRKHKPTELLPVLAQLAVVGGEEPPRRELLGSLPPWGIALAARESVLWGNEHRDAPVTGDSLRTLINTHNNLFTHIAEDDDWALDTMIRLAFEQFPYQESIFEEVARPHALMVEGAEEVEVEVLDDTAWDRLLGAPLGQAVGATFFLQVAANVNNGWFDHAWLDRDDLQPIFDLWPRRTIETRADQLSATFDQFRQAYNDVPHPPTGYERYSYNPLIRRPFLRMPNGKLLAPQPRLILRTISPGALYYAGIEEFGTAFARDLGHLTEHYVGRLLRNDRDNVELHPEITYGKQQMKSIDWFLVLPGVVVMFEVKSARFGLLERAAFGDYRTKVSGLLNKATQQLIRSSDALDASHPSFAHIPNDRPRIGIVVTGEPHYLANTYWVREMLDTAPFPTLTASLREVEELAALPLEEIERQLLHIANDPDRSTWNLANSLNMSDVDHHPILQHAWDAYPWPNALNDDE